MLSVNQWRAFTARCVFLFFAAGTYKSCGVLVNNTVSDLNTNYIIVAWAFSLQIGTCYLIGRSTHIFHIIQCNGHHPSTKHYWLVLSKLIHKCRQFELQNECLFRIKVNVYIECGDSNWVYVVLRYGREGGGACASGCVGAGNVVEWEFLLRCMVKANFMVNAKWCPTHWLYIAWYISCQRRR